MREAVGVLEVEHHAERVGRAAAVLLADAPAADVLYFCQPGAASQKSHGLTWGEIGTYVRAAFPAVIAASEKDEGHG